MVLVWAQKAYMVGWGTEGFWDGSGATAMGNTQQLQQLSGKVIALYTSLSLYTNAMAWYAKSSYHCRFFRMPWKQAISNFNTSLIQYQRDV